jgi:hypothetical protein
VDSVARLKVVAGFPGCGFRDYKFWSVYDKAIARSVQLVLGAVLS